MDSDRAIRLNEGLRDIESIGGNLALPDYVVEDAARLLKRAAAERLPGGRMSWEALAAGAVLLAARDADLERSSAEVAHYAKSHQERVCAAARKVRCDLGLAAELPPVRAGAVEAVLAGLDEPLDGDVRGQVARVGRHLLELADEEPVGPGTSRVTMAASAVYAADRLTPGKYLIQEQVVAAGKTVLDTSKSKVGRYSRELVEVYEERHGEGPAGDPDPAWVALAGGD
jgi:transcription initiation factor TFIIB